MLMSTELPLEPRKGHISIADGGMSGQEIFWRDHQLWLQDCGYMLRPRFRPGWIPSWKDTRKNHRLCEDGVNLVSSQVIDATQISDGAQVTIKKVQKSLHPYEVDIGNFFSAEPLASDSRNHCVPNIRILQVPDDDDLILVVMPRLRRYHSPRFQTFGEAVDFFTQIFEGLQFMHDHHVAHRDCNHMNVMMDANEMYPQGYNFRLQDLKPDMSSTAKHYSRTRRPPRYYLIDFGISRQYDPANGPPLEYPVRGGDKSVPEFRDSRRLCDPFPTDIYYLGNLIKEDFIEGDKYKRQAGYLGFQFIQPLVAEMTDEDPTKRPTIQEVVIRFTQIRQGLSPWKLRSRLITRDEGLIKRTYRGTIHWTKRVGFVIRRIPPIPDQRR